MSAAAHELYAAFDSISVLCQRCCDVMYYLADVFGMTYETLNMLFFYILQPCIYSVLLLWEVLYLYYRLRRHKEGWKHRLSYGVLATSIVPLWYIFEVLKTYIGKNLDELCLVKIQSLYDTAHAYNMSYAEINVYIFILGFLFICLLHLLFLCWRKKKIAYVITLLFALVSPFFVFVFNT